jgi:hypothetical protein
VVSLLNVKWNPHRNHKEVAVEHRQNERNFCTTKIN